jgi:hypothetical protein
VSVNLFVCPPQFFKLLSLLKLLCSSNICEEAFEVTLFSVCLCIPHNFCFAMRSMLHQRKFIAYTYLQTVTMLVNKMPLKLKN